MRMQEHAYGCFGWFLIVLLAATYQPCSAAEHNDSDGKPRRLSRIFTGMASFYGRKFHGKKTASGKPFDMNAFTCAHPTLPFGTPVLVQNEANGAQCQVIVTDRGPFTGNRCIDLSRAAAKKLGITGVAKVVCKTGRCIANGLDRDEPPRQVASRH